MVLVNAMHITASVFINDNESGLHRDYDKWLENWLPSTPRPSATTITAPAKITPTHTTSGKSWVAKWSLRSPTASSTSDRGNTSSTTNSTAAAKSACW